MDMSNIRDNARGKYMDGDRNKNRDTESETVRDRASKKN